MIIIYGASDDLIEIGGDIIEEFPALWNDDVNTIKLPEDITLSMVYSKTGVWRIAIMDNPNAVQIDIVSAPEGDDEDYSDIATVHGDIAWVEVNGQKVMR